MFHILLIIFSGGQGLACHLPPPMSALICCTEHEMNRFYLKNWSAASFNPSRSSHGVSFTFRFSKCWEFMADRWISVQSSRPGNVCYKMFCTRVLLRLLILEYTLYSMRTFGIVLPLIIKSMVLRNTAAWLGTGNYYKFKSCTYISRYSKFKCVAFALNFLALYTCDFYWFAFFFFFLAHFTNEILNDCKNSDCTWKNKSNVIILKKIDISKQINLFRQLFLQSKISVCNN